LQLKISYQRVGEEEVDLTIIFDQDTIDAVKDFLVSFSPDNNTQRLKQIEGSLNPSWRYDLPV
jgi:hypothetical protein